ncbi:ABC transporter substrate-binding protein [Amycolatopsis pithecellobii]|uniref:SsuA/THI5-like domain-containing protein n=1 Tax=Amycolatopsis pithecellobii TaxID=664692 RepID=A0A6N7Z100_9PSEU|nr:ABC transporter substrate-binding protein [Amycolatopsis pithecellobii]MTD58002.1 hypothetical protein [Amycolatopsis pithecellobii]
MSAHLIGSAGARRKIQSARPRRTATILLSVAVLVATLAGCGSSSKEGDSQTSSSATQQIVTINFVGFPATTGASAWIFYGNTGIFQKYGFKLNYLPTAAATATDAEALKSGRADLSIVSPYQFASYMQTNSGVVSVFGLYQKNPEGILYRKDSGISSPADLAGKTVLAATGAPNIADTQAWLKLHGVDNVKIQQVALTQELPLLVANRAPAILTLPFSPAPSMAEKGIPTGQFVFADENPEFDALTYVAAAATTWLQNNKELAQNVLKGLQAALVATKADPGKAVDALIKANPTGAPSKTVAVAQAKSVFDYLQTPNDVGHPYGWMSPDDWTETLKYAQKYAGYTGSLDVSKLFTNDYYTSTTNASP